MDMSMEWNEANESWISGKSEPIHSVRDTIERMREVIATMDWPTHTSVYKSSEPSRGLFQMTNATVSDGLNGTFNAKVTPEIAMKAMRA